MTDATMVAGAVRARPPGVRWVPTSSNNAKPPDVRATAANAARINNRGVIRVIFEVQNLRYPTILVPLFTVFTIIATISLFGLLAAPLYATSRIATALLFGLATGLGGIAWTVASAGRVVKQR